MRLALLIGLLMGMQGLVHAKQVWIPAGNVTLPASYYVPAQTASKKPTPVVILLHGCGGLYTPQGDMGYRYQRMRDYLRELGFGVLIVDSFSPRGVQQVCTRSARKRSMDAGLRANDVQHAVAWLRLRKEVDDSRIGVMGWSHGATTVLKLLGRRHPGVRAAVTFYPTCRSLLGKRDFRVAAPTLVLVGDEDKSTPVEHCRKLQARSGQDLFHIVSYPDVYHDFDRVTGALADADVPNRIAPAHAPLPEPNPEAAQDAYRRTFKWFSRWFDPERSISGVPPRTIK